MTEKTITDTILDEIRSERERQVEKGWTPEHDDKHTGGVLAGAGACYSINAAWKLSPEGGEQLEGVPIWWPLGSSSWKPKTSREDLVRAAALIIAELERIHRNNEVKSSPTHP